ncbi:MAG: ABC transporter substrate-binding protein, partial [Bdellovibrionales bacterium]|nr:ABC transporter substrate-binding protein [Bdellovibrionales bacterium]
PPLSAQQNNKVEQSKFKKIVVSQFGKEKFLLYLPLYIAMEEGLFLKRGIEIDLRFVGNDDQIFASVISGDALFGVGDPVFAAISREKGGPGKIVASMITKLGLSGYTNNTQIPNIIAPQDLKGLRVSSFPAPSTTYTLLSEFIKLNELDKTGTSIVQAGVGAQLAALEAGDVDIAIDLEPSVSIAESKGYRVNFSLDKFTESQAITGISTLESTINDHPEVVQKIVSGLQEALILLHKDRNICLNVAQKLFPNLGIKVIENAVERMLSAGMYPKTAKMEDSNWQRTLKTRLDSGELKKAQATEFTVDNSFAEKAIQELMFEG